MNYIEQINVFWILDAEHSFNGNESRLYFYLLKLSNSLYWKNPLTNADGYTASMVGISVNTLKTARNRLQQAGLIQFKPGGNGARDKCMYKIMEADDVVKKSQNDSIRYQNLIPNLQPNPQPYQQPYQQNTDDINKHKPDLSTDANASVPARKKPTEKNLLYKDCLKIYDVFIKNLTGAGAKIDGTQGKAMKSIISYLKTQVRNKDSTLQSDAIPEKVKESLQAILSNWHLLPIWLQGRTRLTDISSELQNILKGIKDGITNHKKPAGGSNTVTKPVAERGASVDDLQTLKRGGATDHHQ